ncbi:MAG: hypothetical protein ACRDFB_09015, partial [Rhabdochlamydiaceae bacterium]
MEHALKVMTNMTPHQRKKHFNMSEWGKRTDCGTVACLAGHCSLDPWFRKQGFKGSFDEVYGELDFFNIEPPIFFGSKVYNDILTNRSFTEYGHGSYVNVKKAVVKVIKNLKQHIKGVK